MMAKGVAYLELKKQMQISLHPACCRTENNDCSVVTPAMCQ
jgi:hypothetical protein